MQLRNYVMHLHCPPLVHHGGKPIRLGCRTTELSAIYPIVQTSAYCATHLENFF